LPPNYLSTKKYNFLHFIAPDFSIETKTVTLKNLDVDNNKNYLYEGPSISLDSKTGFDWNIGTTFNFLQSNSGSKNKSNTVLNFQSSKNVTLPITKSLTSQVVPNEINLKFDFKEENQKPNLEIPQLIHLAEQKLQNELVSPRMENSVGDNITTSIFKPLGIDNLNLKSWLRFYLSPSNPLGTFIKNFYHFDADDKLSKVEPIKDWLQTLPIYTKGFWVNPKVALVNTETKLFLTQPSIYIPFISEEQWKHFLSMIEKLQNQLMLDNKANSTISSINNTVVSESTDRKDNPIAIPVISTTIPKIEKPTLEFAVKNKLDYNFNFQLFETRTDSLLNNSLDSIKNLNNISPSLAHRIKNSGRVMQGQSLDIAPNEIPENQAPIQIITENQKNKIRKETQSTSSDTSMFCGTQNLQTHKFRNNVQLNFIPYTETYLQTHKFNTQLTSGTYKKSNSVFTKSKNLPFQDTWEPLTVQSWLIVSQVGFSFLIFKILKGLADNYGRELLVYLLDLVALLGFLDDDLKQEIEILMGQREKGFRLIYKNQKSFKDIAGMKSLLPEIVEIVWFLRNSAREFALSQTLPKGILLTGPPGTGKTLLVQALAGEAQVPVLALSGSSLLEPGESGALKLEILFQEARRVAPCIVFIDEIDTLAQKREQVLQNSMGTDERLESMLNSPILSQSKATLVFQDTHNTLNGSESHQNYFTNNVTEEIQAKQDLRREKLRILMQFLVELDGIQARNGVIVIGATNRPEMLDLAILRPGRFDRILELGLPGPEKRVDILKLYAQRLGYDRNLSWNYLSQLTEGFSAADLAGVMNQSCLKAILLESHHTLESIEHGIDRITISETRALYSQTGSVNNLAEDSNLFPSLDHRIKNSGTIMQGANDINPESHKIKNFGTNSIPNKIWEQLDQPDRTKKQYSTSVLRLAYFQAGKIVLSTLLPHQPPVLLAHLWPRQSNLRSVQIARNTQKYSFRFARKGELEHRIIGCYGGKAAEILFLQKFDSSDSYINLSDIGIEDLSFAQLLIRLMIDKWAFYSSSLGAKTLTEIADNKNFQEYKNLVDKINFLDQTGKDVESINSEQMFEVNNFEKNTSEFITLNDEYAEKYSLIPWWQYQISNELEFSTRTFSNWYRLYLPDPQEKERNLEWSAPDEFFHKNDKLNAITNSFAGSTDPNWNDLISIKRDYQIHCFVLQSFNKAIKLLDKNREFLDEIAYKLIQKEILRKYEIESIKNRFTN
jgi:ATP-dependent Zn protease